MVLEKSRNDKFLSEFETRFMGFCERSPLYVSFTISPAGVQVKNIISEQDDSVNLEKQFQFDFNFSVKENIFFIRDWMKENWFPKLTSFAEQEVELSVDEINALMKKENIPLVDAIAHRKSIKTTNEFVIIKLNMKRNELLLENAASHVVSVWKLKCPLIVFVRKLREKKLNSEDGWTELLRYGKHMYDVQPNHVKNEA